MKFFIAGFTVETSAQALSVWNMCSRPGMEYAAKQAMSCFHILKKAGK